MTIAFNRLFTSLGLYCGGLNETNTFLGTTIPTRATTLLTQFDGLAPYAPLTSTIPSTESQEQSGSLAWVQMLSNFAQQTIINEVTLDHPLISPSFSNCLTELVRQMILNSQTLTAAQCTTSIASVGSPTGDEQFIASTILPETGVASDYAIPDSFLIQCTNDSYHSATAYQEPFSLVARPAATPLINYAYGTATNGSGVSTSQNAVDPAVNGGLVTDPAFLLWGTGPSVNIPQKWTIFSGTAGTNVFQVAASDPRSAGNPVISLVGDGSTVVKVRQAVNVIPGNSYALSYRVYMKTDESSHWQVSVSLTNSAGAAVAGPGSYSNVVTSTSSASLGANWTNFFNGTIVAPVTVPTGGLFLEIRLCINGTLTSPAQAGATAYVDYVTLQTESPLYTGGPSLTIVSGLTPAVEGDTRTLGVTFATGTIPLSLLRGIDRLTGGLAQYLPTLIPTVTSGATQSNSLVT